MYQLFINRSTYIGTVTFVLDNFIILIFRVIMWSTEIWILPTKDSRRQETADVHGVTMNHPSSFSIR